MSALMKFLDLLHSEVRTSLMKRQDTIHAHRILRLKHHQIISYVRTGKHMEFHTQLLTAVTTMVRSCSLKSFSHWQSLIFWKARRFLCMVTDSRYVIGYL